MVFVSGLGANARLAAVLGASVLAVALCLLVWRRMARSRAARRKAQTGLGAFVTSRRDALTALAGRAAFIDKLSACLHGRAPSALLLIDIDRFSAINTRHGIRGGDEVLIAMADRLRALAPGQDGAARVSGDQFALLLPADNGLNGVEESALAVLRALTSPIDCAAGRAECAVSIGVAMLPSQGRDADAAMRAASGALAQAKSAGGAGWRFFDADRGEEERQRAHLAVELRDAVERGRIIPHYQPVVELAGGALVGLEVLARWNHPTRGLLPPDLFIPLAEEMGLCGVITQQLMRRVIADSREWPSWLYFAFNASPGQLRELIGMLRNPPVWPEGRLDPTRLEVEITESALIEDLEIAHEVLGLLQAQGTRVVLDDFGIGYSNFFHLRELPFDRIKIDRSFILDIATDPRAEACVRAMLALGATLGIPMVAEGIESAQTEARLMSLGCRFAQGFLYAEPVPATGVPALLRRLVGTHTAQIRITG